MLGEAAVATSWLEDAVNLGLSGGMGESESGSPKDQAIRSHTLLFEAGGV
jgi:hypothetical protein